MANAKPDFDELLRTATRSELQGAVWRWPAPLALPQAERLRTHALALAPAPQPLRLAVVHTYTSDLLDHVPMFAARAAQVTEQLVAAALRGQSLYDPL